MDLNNLEDPPTGVRHKKKQAAEGTKTLTVNLVIYILDGKNTMEGTKHNSMNGWDAQNRAVHTTKETWDKSYFAEVQEQLQLYFSKWTKT